MHISKSQEPPVQLERRFRPGSQSQEPPVQLERWFRPGHVIKPKCIRTAYRGD